MSIDLSSIPADLPDGAAAVRFLERLAESAPREYKKLIANRSLLSDVSTIASFSNYLSATLLENPQHIAWLEKRRRDSGVRTKEELLESLGRFRAVNSSLEETTVYERFRRRELVRIFLRDIRRLATIAEITEEISNLADTILETALEVARSDVDKRFGSPQQVDSRGKATLATFCIAALGKLGSRELNYASDIDLLFLYSSEGETGGGLKGKVTNREYFVKLAELIIKLTGQNPSGPSAYRVDMRLRPHGTLGALAMSTADTTAYYLNEARDWERQVLIRSRAAAGDYSLFAAFIQDVESVVFSKDTSPAQALASIRKSKQLIDSNRTTLSGYDLKLGRGGIREIEFLAQGLQLAYGGPDSWLRSPHTLISLARLAEHGHLSSHELSQLAAAYDFLRRAEHIVQMENGLQTHLVPKESGRALLLAERMRFAGYKNFSESLIKHTNNVNRIFNDKTRVSNEDEKSRSAAHAVSKTSDDAPLLCHSSTTGPLGTTSQQEGGTTEPDKFLETAQAVAARLEERIGSGGSYANQLGTLRTLKAQAYSSIREGELTGSISAATSKTLQTRIAEACIAAAADIANRQNGARTKLAVLAVGKLGSGTLDYGSDLDLVIAYDDSDTAESAEKHARVVETFVNVLSAMTRDGNLYRVDLRLRPHGSKGLIAVPHNAFLKYLAEEAAIWEMLAFVKLRGLDSIDPLASSVEEQAREIIHERARAIDAQTLRTETYRIRTALEAARPGVRSPAEIDLKHGAGGMLDIYFATRFLQLRDDVRDSPKDRSTASSLRLLRDAGSLTADQYGSFSAGYDFLSRIDHQLRLLSGRSRRLPVGNAPAMLSLAKSSGVRSGAELMEQIAVNRLLIRDAFDSVLGVK